MSGFTLKGTRCDLEQYRDTPEHHALHMVSGLDPAATSVIHLAVRNDAKRGGTLTPTLTPTPTLTLTLTLSQASPCAASCCRQQAGCCPCPSCPRRGGAWCS